VLTEKEVRQILEAARALMQGHFQLSSGRHSLFYLQCAKVLQYPDLAARLGEELAKKCHGLGKKISVVLSPAVGGLILGHEVARPLSARCLFAEREKSSGLFSLRRGFQLKRGDEVLLVDDVLTTGGSLRELAQLAAAAGAKVAGIASLAERGSHVVDFAVPRRTLIKLDFEDYAPADCPACRNRLPLEKPGSKPEAS